MGSKKKKPKNNDKSKNKKEKKLDPDKIYAAGTLPYRLAERVDKVEVLLIHRQRYDDWSFPKGKQEDNETKKECALRETEEETGLAGELSYKLPKVKYSAGSKQKIVSYWVMENPSGEFIPNKEVDEILWASPGAAANILSYDHDKKLLSNFVELIDSD